MVIIRFSSSIYSYNNNEHFLKLQLVEVYTFLKPELNLIFDANKGILNIMPLKLYVICNEKLIVKVKDCLRI